MKQTKKVLKGQNAIEFLMTYGWAFAIITVVLGALVILGVFNPGAFVNSQCLTPADFTCAGALASNGLFFINIRQSTNSEINVTAIGCNSNKTYLTMQPISPPIPVPVGNNFTYSVRCFDGPTPFSGSLGSVYKGYLILNYTDLQSGFAKTSFSVLVEKVAINSSSTP